MYRKESGRMWLRPDFRKYPFMTRREGKGFRKYKCLPFRDSKVDPPKTMPENYRFS
jgi:hypothetical protein